MQTIRQQIIAILSREKLTVRDISQELGIAEKEIYSHLDHIARSLTCRGGELIISPYRCLDCGYLFKDRQRFNRPGRCPRCKKSRLQPAAYQIKNTQPQGPVIS